MGHKISEAIDMLRKGSKMRHGSWGPTDPAFLVFVPGRIVKASFEPMTNVIGEGNEFLALDHVDAVYGSVVDDKLFNPTVKLGYQFKQEEILNDAWFEV